MRSQVCHFGKRRSQPARLAILAMVPFGSFSSTVWKGSRMRGGWRGQAKDIDGAVTLSKDQVPAFRAESYASDFSGRLPDGLLIGIFIPENDAASLIHRSHLAVGCIRHGVDPS